VVDQREDETIAKSVYPLYILIHFDGVKTQYVGKKSYLMFMIVYFF